MLKDYEYLYVADKYYDLNAYAYCASSLDYDYFLFLNSNSIINCDNWDTLFLKALVPGTPVLIGATASCEPLGYSVPCKLGSNFSVGLFLLRVINRGFRALAYAGFSTCFPNPHIRTNAFLIDRITFLAYFDKYGIPKTKIQCHAIESGSNSLTRFVDAMGGVIALVTVEGVVYGLRALEMYPIFRTVKGHEKLLVTDNRTREFDVANPNEKKILAWDAWRV